MLDAAEACDDGNISVNDGCDSACQVESGYVCPTPGVACDAECGDGMIVGTRDLLIFVLVRSKGSVLYRTG